MTIKETKNMLSSYSELKSVITSITIYDSWLNINEFAEFEYVNILKLRMANIRNCIEKHTNNNTYRLLLNLRYIHGLTVEQCSVCMNKSVRHTYRLLKEAIELLTNNINVEEKACGTMSDKL